MPNANGISVGRVYLYYNEGRFRIYHGHLHFFTYLALAPGPLLWITIVQSPLEERPLGADALIVAPA